MSTKKFRSVFITFIAVVALFASTSLAQSRDRKTTHVSTATVNAGCNDNWDTSFTTNGVNRNVYAIVPDGLGNVYIGGSFSDVQGMPIVGVAKWNGSSWSSLGLGINGTVMTIAILGNDVYVGGDFNVAVSNGFARNVAKWDGTSWTRLNNGLGGGTHVVNSVFVYNNEVYATGGFNTEDGSPTTGTAKWDGTAWVAVGTGAPMGNKAIVKDGVVYVAAIGVRKWDGTNWSSMSGLTGTVRSIAFAGNDLYAVGTPTINGTDGVHVARWNGSAWVSHGSFSNAFLNTVAVVGSDVYVGGYIPGNPFNNIAKVTATTWTSVSGGLLGGGPNVLALASIDNKLWAGGDFVTAGGSGARNLAIYSNAVWSGFAGTGIDSAAAAIAVSGTDVYVGGTFTSAGSVVVNKIAKWNSITNTWSPLGTGVPASNNSVNSIAVAGSKVYAGGNFTNIGGVSANNIAVWNGTAWSALGTGVNGTIYSVIVKGEEVYVGGTFTTAGGGAANRVAKWNGTAWVGLNSTILSSTVVDMVFKGDDLYIASPTTTVANPAYFSKFDGTTWTALGADLGDRGVSSLAVVGNDIYVAGGFTVVNGMAVNRIVKWNGTSFSAVGNGLPSPTNQFGGIRLVTSGNDLFAVGDFTVAGGNPANRIAIWDGTAWSSLGTGLNNSGTVVRAGGGSVFAGGPFTTAGCNASPYFARWRQTEWTGVVNTDWHTAGNWGNSTVPATNAAVTIYSSNTSITSADVTLSGLIVTGGRTLSIGAGRTLTVNGTLDLNGGSLTGTGSLVVNGDLILSNGNVTDLGGVVINGNLNLSGGIISGTAPVSLTSCRTTSLAGGSNTSYISSPFTRCVDGSGTYRYPVGAGGIYAPIDLSGISGSGPFTVEAKNGSFAGAATGLPANRLGRWWSLTNGGITQANMTLNYFDTDVNGIEGRYRAYSIVGGAAQIQPTVLSLTTNKATVSNLTSFGAITLAEGPATFETLSGRITTPRGRGAERVIVTMTDSEGNIRYAFTNMSGYYRFYNVETWKTYTIRLLSKRHTFTAPERVLEFIEGAPTVNFVSTDH